MSDIDRHEESSTDFLKSIIERYLRYLLKIFGVKIKSMHIKNVCELKDHHIEQNMIPNKFIAQTLYSKSKNHTIHEIIKIMKEEFV